MKKLMRIRRAEKGFTLIEVIITIVIAAILGSFLVTFMSSVPKSVNPVIQTQNLAAAQLVMEKITADYERYIRGETGAPVWGNIGLGYVTNSDATTSINVYGSNPVDFTLREVTVTAGDQKLVSYFIIK